jgi:carbon-monoxide dehydrogenase small subunit
MSTEGTHDLRVVTVVVNGQRRSAAAEPRRLLSDFLRDDLGLTGTHVGCEHGVCGACTVRIDGVLARSCTAFAVQVDGSEIRTIEGVGDDGAMSPVQEAFRAKHGLQCGFCTPGFVLTVEALLEEIPEPTEPEIREYLAGNVCRCTGYVGIVEAVKDAAERLRSDTREEHG